MKESRQPQPARFHYVLTINTKPEAAQQYEDSVRKIVYAANKTANVQPWVAFSSELHTFFFLSRPLLLDWLH